MCAVSYGIFAQGIYCSLQAYGIEVIYLAEALRSFVSLANLGPSALQCIAGSYVSHLCLVFYSLYWFPGSCIASHSFPHISMTLMPWLSKIALRAIVLSQWSMCLPPVSSALLCQLSPQSSSFIRAIATYPSRNVLYVAYVLVTGINRLDSKPYLKLVYHVVYVFMQYPVAAHLAVVFIVFVTYQRLDTYTSQCRVSHGV